MPRLRDPISNWSWLSDLPVLAGLLALFIIVFTLGFLAGTGRVLANCPPVPAYPPGPG